MSCWFAFVYRHLDPRGEPPAHQSALLLHDITHSGHLLQQMQPLFSLPVWSLLNTGQKVLIQTLIHGRGTANLCGFKCNRLSEHQLDVCRKPSQLIIRGSDSLSGCFSAFGKVTKMKMKGICIEILSRKWLSLNTWLFYHFGYCSPMIHLHFHFQLF